MRWLFALALVGLVACQHDVETPFPAGLEPFEPDPVPPLTGTPTETLQTQTNDGGFIHVYGRGDVLAPPATVWAAAKNPEVLAAVCSTTKHTSIVGDEPQYEYSFVIHYEEDNILTVIWDDQWRFGTVEGTPDAPTLAMIKHQKIDGSSFISRSEGTIEVLATDDDNVTELDFVEHLDSVGASTDDVLRGVTHTYQSIVAATHGLPSPACP